jgi:N-acetylmuramoyl-L-alanine amidase
MLAVAMLCACAAWLSIAAETSKKKSDEEESSSKSRTSKTAPASKSGTSKSTTPATTGKSTSSKATSGKSDSSKTASSKTGTSTPSKGSTGKSVASKSDSSKSKGTSPSEAAPVNSAPSSAKKSTASTPSSSKKKSESSSSADDKKVAAVSTPAKPADEVKPKMSTPVEKPITTTASEPPPKDVTTSNLASSRNMEGNEQHGEFDKPDPEDEPKPKPKPTAKSNDRSTAVATTSSDMVGWELIRYQERDYVTASSIHKFYRFTNLEIKGSSVWFRSSVLVMKATLGSQDLLINNIKFVLSDPVLELKGKPCFSRLDLCKLIDPVLRPAYIGSGSMFDTVILDPGHGGHDSGARGIYGYEKEFALKLAFAVKA